MTPREKLDRLCGAGQARVVWLSLASAETAEIAALSGADACVVDAEHGRIGTARMAAMVAAVSGAGRPALVRLGETGEARVKHALDAGADGLIVPQIESTAAAEAAACAFYFPPRGHRGNATPVIRATAWGRDRDYAAGWNARGLLIAQIESPAGLDAAADIARVEGVDMLFFGPYDYAGTAGLDPFAQSDRLAEAGRAMAAAAAAAGRLSGTFPWPEADSAALAGFDMVSAASDVIVLREGLAAALSRGREG